MTESSELPKKRPQSPLDDELNRRARLRTLTGALAIVAALFCVLIVALWIQSYRKSVTYGMSHHISISAERGDLMIVRTAERNFRVPAGLHIDPLSDPNDPWNFRRVSKTTWDIGLAHNEDFIGALHITIIRVWAILILAMIPWVVWVGNRWRKSQVGQDQRNNF